MRFDTLDTEHPRGERTEPDTTLHAPNSPDSSPMSSAQFLESMPEAYGQGRLIKHTRSLCPQCLQSIDAQVFEREGQVWMDKHCSEHGCYSALLAADTRHYYHVPGLREARSTGGSCCAPSGGCCAPTPAVDANADDSRFGQAWSNHSCNILIEITERCNLTCPTCYAGSSPYHSRMMSLDTFTQQLDGLLARGKSNADVIQISGGEPTVHPELFTMLDILAAKGFERVCINTNGIKLAQEDYVQKLIANPNIKLSIYLQFDGFAEQTHVALRGRGDLLKLKQQALKHSLAAGIKVHPVMTLTRGINDHELGDFIQLAVEYPQIKDVIIQPAMYSGRYENPRRVDRLTLAETVQMVCQQFGVFNAEDFGPIPCSDPNCFGMAMALRGKKSLIPISRYFPKPQHWQEASNQDLIASVSDTINAPQAMGGILRWALGNEEIAAALAQLDEEEVEYLFSVLAAQQTAVNEQNKETKAALWDHLLMVNIKPFMDAYTYDQDRIDQCCVHILDPQGQPVSFCEYNAIHRPRQELQARTLALQVK